MGIRMNLVESPGPGPIRRLLMLSTLLALVLVAAAVASLAVVRGRSRQTTPPTTTPVAAAVVSPTAQRTQGTAPTATQVPPTATRGVPSATATPPLPAATVPASPTTAPAPATATATVVPPLGSRSPTAGPSATPAVTKTAPAAGASPSAPAAAYTWYFAEGASVPPFRTSYALLNPGSQTANVTVTLLPENGKAVKKAVQVPGGSQVQVLGNEILANAAFGAAISSDRPVYVQRVTVGDRDGTSSAGVSLSQTWYFPEGRTGDDFTTWILVANPGTEPATLTVTYLPVEQKAVVRTYTAPPTARLTIAAQKDVANGLIGIILQSSKPVAAEVATYLDEQKAGYGEPGVPVLSKTWFVPSANTQDGFSAQIAVLNPNAEPANVKVTAIGSAEKKTQSYPVPAKSKFDIIVNDLMDLQLVSLALESDRPVAAQAVTFYMSGQMEESVAAYSSLPLRATASQFYVPASPSSDLYDSYATVFNPGTATASVAVTYYGTDGQTIEKTYTVPSQGRVTLRVATEVKDMLVAALALRSSVPVAADGMTMFRTTFGATAAVAIAAR